MKRFKAKLKAEGPGGGWTFLHLPFDAEKAFGSRARVSVRGTINGFAFRSSIFPNGDGTHHAWATVPRRAGVGPVNDVLACAIAAVAAAAGAAPRP